MKGKRLLAANLALCLCLCACSGREISTSGSAGEQIPSESSPSQVVESLDELEKSESSDESSPTLSEENDIIEQQSTEQSSALSEEKVDEYINILDYLLLLEWDNASDIPPMNFVMWYGYQMQNSLSTEKYMKNDRDGLFFPAEEFEAEVGKYFDVSIQHLRSDPSVYLKAEQCYRTPTPLMPLAEISLDIKTISRYDAIIEIEVLLNYIEQDMIKEMVLALEEVDEGIRFLSYNSKS